MSRPRLTVIAGPNGSGKSTLTRNLGVVGELIDPDAIARAINPDNPEAAAGPAGRQALMRADACIKEQRDFTQETTMSGNSTSRLIDRAKAAGFEVNLRYVCLKSAAANQARVAKRVEEGGHSVPPEDVERRYHRSLAALPLVLAKVDSATLYDNSSKEGHRIVARFDAGKLTFQDTDTPAWARNAIQKFKEQDQ